MPLIGDWADPGDDAYLLTRPSDFILSGYLIFYYVGTHYYERVNKPILTSRLYRRTRHAKNSGDRSLPLLSIALQANFHSTLRLGSLQISLNWIKIAGSTTLHRARCWRVNMTRTTTGTLAVYHGVSAITTC